MGFHEIAMIKFEAAVKMHPQLMIDAFDFKAPNWNRNGRKYTKDDELGRYTLQKTGEKTFALTIEQLDFFGIDLGGWDEKDYPERENIIKETLGEIEKEFKTKVNVTEIIRDVK